MNRQKYNRAILVLLSQIVEKYPELRFGQILSNIFGDEDLFYIESEKSYKQIDSFLNSQNPPLHFSGGSSQIRIEKSHLGEKSFNFEAAKAGAPVCTRDGRKVRIMCFDSKQALCDTPYPIVALLEYENGMEGVRSYTIDGKQTNYGVCDDDLVMASAHRERRWVNVYRNKYGFYDLSPIYYSKDDAVASSKEIVLENEEYVKTIKIELDD